MKSKTKYLFIAIIASQVYLQSCQTCDNCEISPAPKQVTVVDNANKNLIFGASSIYNPDDITIKDEFGNVIEFFPNVDNETIDFSFKVPATSYFIKLNNTDTDTIVFVYGKDKQIECCNEFDVTKATSVNGKSVANEDAIKIVK